MKNLSDTDRRPDLSCDERVVKDLMHCARYLRTHTEGKGSQRRVLSMLRSEGSMTQQDLLEKMGVRASSLSELLSKLESKGFIIKEKSDTDKRNYNVTITDDGLQALQEMQAHHQAAMADLLSGLSEEERSQLSFLLSKLHRLWSERGDPSMSFHSHHKGCKQQ